MWMVDERERRLGGREEAGFGLRAGNGREVKMGRERKKRNRLGVEY